MSKPIKRHVGRHKAAFTDQAAQAATARKLLDTTVNADKWCVMHRETNTYLLIDDDGSDGYVSARHHATGFDTKIVAITAATHLGLSRDQFTLDRPTRQK